MSISILNRGASGGLKPELTVIAPSGSTIDLLQNGIIVDTYTFGASETEHTFVVKVGTYTVRGTLETYNKSIDVVIDAVGQYEVVIEYKLYLYREGDECTAVTGGYVIKDYSNYVTLTKNSDNLLLQATASNANAFTVAYFATEDQIPLDGYSVLKVRYDRYVSVNYSNPSINVYVALYSDLSKPSDVWEHGNRLDRLSIHEGAGQSAADTDRIMELDISTLTNSVYLTVDMTPGYYGSGTVWYKIKDIWLE